MALFDKLLVALDGSRTSESSLPYLTELVSSTSPHDVVLLSVIETDRDTDRLIAERYLARIANQLDTAWKRSGIPVPSVRTVAEMAKGRAVSAAILEVAQEEGAELVILASHGRSGSDRWIMGMVAEKVLQRGDMSVFLVRADDVQAPNPNGLKHLLVPMDGSETAEQVLPYVESLAMAVKAEAITLMYVRPPPEGRNNPTVRPTLDFRPFPREDPVKYLEGIGRGLADSGARIRTRIRIGDPGKEIIREAEESEVDLIIMSAVGRTALPGRAFGQTSDEVIHGSPVPVLITRTAPARVRV